jgi:NADP-dependent 3-hydroxy acid dehydrogenase YdfG
MKELNGKKALITGASSGIGKATAEKLAEEGVDVALASRTREKLEEIGQNIEEEYDVETFVRPTDVTDELQVEEMVEETVEEFGRLDIVFNNAGLAMTGEIEDMPTEHYRKTMDVNVDGMFFTARAVIPHLKESEGNLIFTGSIAGKYPRGGNPLYAASKWWTRGFALSLSSQIGDENVAVTVINPSEVRTDFNSEEGEAFEKTFEKGEVTEPEDIAESVVYAARQEDRNNAAEIDLYRRDKLGDTHLG